MKVALVQDYIKEYGGAEKVLETLHEMYPDSDVYTLVYLPKYLGPHKERFKNWKIKALIHAWVPFQAKMISMFRFVDYLFFRKLDLSAYDLVIVSMAGNYSAVNLFIKGSKTLHICYCHTPPRYLYGYATANKWNRGIIRRILLVLGKIPMHFIRLRDYLDAQKPDIIIANSQEIASRIVKFYRRIAVVIHPPIDVPNIGKPIPANKRNYYLTGGRLARAKRFDLAIEVCTKLNLPLKVFGRGFSGSEAELRAIAGNTVEFLGEVSQEEKWNLIKNAKAYISPSLQEDFGMLNLEVNGVGTGVIAYKSGGVTETLVDGKTAVFFNEPTADSLIGAIKRYNTLKIRPEDCIARAKMFDKEIFVRKIKKIVSENIKK